MTRHVTIVEDDPDVRAILTRSLGADGFRVTALESGVGIDDVFSADPADLIILDIGLPEIDGLTIAQQIRRQSDVAIIILSGRGDLADRVVGLEIGADDYITKPFEPREILARARSVIRRSQYRNHAIQAANTHHGYRFSEWTFDPIAHSLHDANGESINLTSGEFKLLEVLVTNAGRVLSRDQLMDACYGSASPVFDRSVDVCIGRLRKKLRDDPRSPAMIRTMRNFGYVFAARVTRH